eukprot:681871-Pyramimonas_sp.AAC.1
MWQSKLQDLPSGEPVPEGFTPPISQPWRASSQLPRQRRETRSLLRRYGRSRVSLCLAMLLLVLPVNLGP